MQSAQSQEKPPFYEHRGFRGAVAVIGLLTALTAFVGVPNLWSVAEDVTEEAPLPLSNTAIVLDASAAMAKPFGGGTKLDAAKDAIAKFAASSSRSGLALRQTGGDCYEDGKVLVGPGAGHGDDVQEEVSDVRPAGVSNLINTVKGAIDEFTQEDFHRESSIRRIVVFMGGEDSCIEAAGEEVSAALAGLGVQTTFRMYALGLSEGEMRNVARFKAEVAEQAEVEVLKVDNEGQLEEVVDQEVDEMAAGEVPVATSFQSLRFEGELSGEELALEAEEPTDPEGIETTTEVESPEVTPNEGEAELAPSEAEAALGETESEPEAAPSEGLSEAVPP